MNTKLFLAVLASVVAVTAGGGTAYAQTTTDNPEQVTTVINSLVLILGTLVPTALVAFGIFKKKLSAFTAFVVELDEDLKDNHLSQEEYTRLVTKFKALLV